MTTSLKTVGKSTASLGIAAVALATLFGGVAHASTTEAAKTAASANHCSFNGNARGVRTQRYISCSAPAFGRVLMGHPKTVQETITNISSKPVTIYTTFDSSGEQFTSSGECNDVKNNKPLTVLAPHTSCTGPLTISLRNNKYLLHQSHQELTLVESYQPGVVGGENLLSGKPAFLPFYIDTEPAKK